jgi:hypothetical protein
MKYLRNKRRLAVLSAAATVVGVTLSVVLPALASSLAVSVPPAAEPSGVTPTLVDVGGNGTCSNIFGLNTGAGTGVYEYDNSNPKTQTNLPSLNGDGVAFDITMSTGKDKDKYFSFVAHGAAIIGVGVNGGTQTTAYDYRTTTNGYVTQDGAVTGQSLSSTGLHAPQGPNQLYSVSHLTFCYKVGTVTGRVYQDLNYDGANNDGSTAGLGGWTVNLYDHAGSLVRSTQSAPDGSYNLSAVFTDSSYTVCEAPPSGAWAQTEPTSSSVCHGTGELVNGYTLSSPASFGTYSGRDFGNVQAITCTSGPFGIPGYQVGTCKPGETYVFQSGTISSGLYAGHPYVNYAVGDPTQPQVATVEKVTFADPFTADSSGNPVPTYTSILYLDDNGFAGTFESAMPMQYCELDPRDTSASEYPNSYALQSPYDAVGAGGSGLVLPGSETACLISLKITAPSAGGTTGALEAYLYALGDSGRLPN